MNFSVSELSRLSADLLPAGAKGFAVLDLETTGTGVLCRILEIALLLLAPDGTSEAEWSTVINPGVPIPNVAVHGIDERLAAAAPSFAAVAPTLAALLEGRVLVAHNLDRGCLPGQIPAPILRHHFWEASDTWPDLVLDWLPSSRALGSWATRRSSTASSHALWWASSGSKCST